MRRGCISLGEVKCDYCQQTVLIYERYLVVVEADGQEAEKGETRHYCVKCATKKGYATIKVEKDEKSLTFFT